MEKHITIVKYNQNIEENLKRIRNQKLKTIKVADNLIYLIKDLCLEALNSIDNLIISPSSLIDIKDIPDPFNETFVEYSMFFLKESFNRNLSRKFSERLYTSYDRNFEISYEKFHQFLADKIQSIQIKERELNKTETKGRNDEMVESKLLEKIKKVKEKFRGLQEKFNHLNEKVAQQVIGKVSETVYKSVDNKIYINFDQVVKVVKGFKCEGLDRVLQKHCKIIENVKVSDDLKFFFACKD